MEFRTMYFGEVAYEYLVANRKRRANACLADYYPSTKGVDFDTQVAPALQVVHALESSFHAYNYVRDDMVACEVCDDCNLPEIIKRVSECISVLMDNLNTEYVKSDQDVSKCLRNMMKDMLRWTAAMFDTLADNVHVVEDTKSTADDLFDD